LLRCNRVGAADNIAARARSMGQTLYKYKCDKSGKTYTVGEPAKSTVTSSVVSTLKLEATCQDCGEKHTLFVEHKE
jgi:hypothetical protein